MGLPRHLAVTVEPSLMLLKSNSAVTSAKTPADALMLPTNRTTAKRAAVAISKRLLSRKASESRREDHELSETKHVPLWITISYFAFPEGSKSQRRTKYETQPLLGGTVHSWFG
ncbi:hypothetical protein PsorP6_006845 [Peronosclerospora sorghi]|uniref:Uncharacterized protein n=1 Tax=Peronosclerospora sorghi TaxID=230839 RepID=A0ACC0W7M2_9STRA|nr:hypothetical protein PsorP6_006845 [Peronosclerospora sorghi]